VPATAATVAVWPSWRGGHHEGRLDAPLPLRWTADEGIRWKTPVPGAGHSSPIVFGDQVYVSAADLDQGANLIDRWLRVATMAGLGAVVLLAVQGIASRCDPRRSPSAGDLLAATGVACSVLLVAILATTADALFDFPRCNIRGWITGAVFASLCLALAAAATDRRWQRLALGAVGAIVAIFLLVAFPSKDYAFRGGIGSVRMQVSLVACAIPLLVGAAIAVAGRRAVLATWPRTLALAAGVAGLATGAVLLLQHLLVFRDGAFPERPYEPAIAPWWLAALLTMVAVARAVRRAQVAPFWTNLSIVAIGSLSTIVGLVVAVERLATRSVYLAYQLDRPRVALSAPSVVVGTVAAIVAVLGLALLWRARTREARPGRPATRALAWTAAALAVVYFVRVNYAATEPQLVRTIISLSRASGEIRWTLKGLAAAQPPMDGRNTPATPTPVTDGRMVCAYFGTPGLMCADVAGQPLWERRDLPYDGIYGAGFSPVLADGLVVLSSQTPDGAAVIHALDAATGATRWQHRFQASRTITGNNRTPIVRDMKGTKVLVVWGLDDVRGFALETGAPLWRHPADSGGDLVSSAVSDGTRLFLADINGTSALDVARLADGQDAVLWTSNARANCASPVLANGLLFAVSDGGIATATDAATGALRWRQRLPGHYYASPVASATAVYFTNSDGLTTVTAAAPVYQALAASDLGEETFASMAAAPGELYVRTVSAVYAIAGTEPPTPGPAVARLGAP
jgi:outer membrane protein assembly factor BamB